MVFEPVMEPIGELELRYPAAGSPPFSVAVHAADVECGVTSPGNHARVRFFRQPQAADIGMEARLFLGYRGRRFGKWPVFTGTVERLNNEALVEAELRDGAALLDRARFSPPVNPVPRLPPAENRRHVTRVASAVTQDVHTFRSTTCQQVVEHILRAAGVETWRLDLPGAVLAPYVIQRGSALDALQAAARAFRIVFGFYFDADGQFVWAPPPWPSTPAGEIKYGRDTTALNVGDLDRDNRHHRPISIETPLMPWLRAGDTITVDDPRISAAPYTAVITSIRHALGDASTRSRMAFEGPSP